MPVIGALRRYAIRLGAVPTVGGRVPVLTGAGDRLRPDPLVGVTLAYYCRGRMRPKATPTCRARRASSLCRYVEVVEIDAFRKLSRTQTSCTPLFRAWIAWVWSYSISQTEIRRYAEPRAQSPEPRAQSHNS
jgi:hypothetical protein